MTHIQRQKYPSKGFLLPALIPERGLSSTIGLLA